MTGTRQTNPAIDLHEIPRIDCILLSHYHADHFDQDVEASLRRDLPIITTPHAKSHLAAKGEREAFSAVHALDFFESMMVDIVPGNEDGKKDVERGAKMAKAPGVKVTGMPGKHVGDGILGAANDFLKAVPPTNGWMVELGNKTGDTEDSSWQCGYR